MADEPTISEHASHNGGGAPDAGLASRLGPIGDLGRVSGGLAKATTEFARAGRRLAGALAEAGRDAAMLVAFGCGLL